MPQFGSESASKRVHLNSADLLFSEIRDQNFANVGAVLSKRTKELSSVVNVSLRLIIAYCLSRNLGN